MRSTEICAEQQKIGDKDQEMLIRSNCTNSIARSRGMGYENC